MKTRVLKWGNSLALRIPKSFAIEAGLCEGAPVELALVEGKTGHPTSHARAAHAPGAVTRRDGPEPARRVGHWACRWEGGLGRSRTAYRMEIAGPPLPGD